MNETKLLYFLVGAVAVLLVCQFIQAIIIINLIHQVYFLTQQLLHTAKNLDGLANVIQGIIDVLSKNAGESAKLL